MSYSNVITLLVAIDNHLKYFNFFWNLVMASSFFTPLNEANESEHKITACYVSIMKIINILFALIQG